MRQKTEMRVLLYSSVLYLLGITIVLYLKPQLMFHHDGRWKEFGVSGEQTTYVPFWLFCIIWAVVAYAIIRMIYSDEIPVPVKPRVAPRVAPADDGVSPLPVPEATPAQVKENSQGKPGYYKLDEAVMKNKGVPRYVYIGEEKPADLEA
jgi:hypothetical protein